jgi:pimeloyl-ACP methyl ester carboxylesterase
VESGSASGVPVLLLHGITDSWRSFAGVLPLLPPWIRAFAVTHRGHGDATRPETGYAFADYASDLAAFMDALGLASAVVIGHSLGSSVAQRFAIDHPERTRGLVLVAAFAATRNHPLARELWDSAIANLSDPVDPAVARDFQQSTLARPVPAELLETAVAESLKLPARVWRAAFQGFLQDELTGERGRIRARTLILWGDRDSFCTRADQDALVAEISGARLVVYPGTGHALHWEEPEHFASDLAAFVAEIAR